MYLHPSDKDINQLKAFLKLARSAIKMADLWRGSVVLDMPADSKGWREPSLINFQSKFNLSLVRYDRCCYDARDKKGLLLLGSRQILTNNPNLQSEIGGKVCPGGHTHSGLPSDVALALAGRLPLRFAVAIHVAQRKYLSDAVRAWNAMRSDSNNRTGEGVIPTTGTTVPAVPALPRACVAAVQHRESIDENVFIPPYPAAVARRVPNNEWPFRMLKGP